MMRAQHLPLFTARAALTASKTSGDYSKSQGIPLPAERLLASEEDCSIELILL
jgi:hypothetical protein